MDYGIGTPTGLSGGVLPEGEIVLEDQVDEVVEETLESLPPEPPKASDYLEGNTRKEDELYCDFKCRLHWEKILRKQYFKGRTIWKSDERGEVRKPERKRRDSKLRRKKDAQKARREAIREAQGKRTAEELNTTRRAKKRMARLVENAGN